jgi:hypothetical protein
MGSADHLATASAGALARGSSSKRFAESTGGGTRSGRVRGTLSPDMQHVFWALGNPRDGWHSMPSKSPNSTLFCFAVSCHGSWFRVFLSQIRPCPEAFDTTASAVSCLTAELLCSLGGEPHVQASHSQSGEGKHRVSLSGRMTTHTHINAHELPQWLCRGGKGLPTEHRESRTSTLGCTTSNVLPPTPDSCQPRHAYRFGLRQPISFSDGSSVCGDSSALPGSPSPPRGDKAALSCYFTFAQGVPRERLQ